MVFSETKGQAANGSSSLYIYRKPKSVCTEKRSPTDLKHLIILNKRQT